MRYNRSREAARLLLYCLLEHCPYRQLTMGSLVTSSNASNSVLKEKAPEKSAVI